MTPSKRPPRGTHRVNVSAPPLSAIISDAYTRAKDSLEHCPQVDVGEEITDVFRELGHNIKAAARWCLCGWCRKRRSSPDATVTPVANDAQPTPVSPVKEAAPATQQATGHVVRLLGVASVVLRRMIVTTTVACA